MSRFRCLRFLAAFSAGLLLPFLPALPLQAADADPLFPAGLCYAAGPENERIVVPLESTVVILDVKPGLVEAEVVQTFTNRTGHALEATYLYPLPADATLTAAELQYADRVIKSVVREKKQAQADYDSAKAEGRKAALVAQHDGSLFSTAVANFLPGETVKVAIRFIQPVAVRADAVEVRFPMVTARKYFPAETTAAAPGNSAPTPPGSVAAGHVYAYDIQVSGFPVEQIESGSHRIQVEPAAGGDYRVSLAETITVPDRDFVLRITTKPARAAQATLVTETTATGQYGLFTVFPPPRSLVAAPVAGGRDILFLVDHSGSMNGPRMSSARLGVQGCLMNLAPEDRFQIVVFDSSYAFYQPVWVQATPAAVAQAVLYMDQVQANSGTEMQPALNASLDFIGRNNDASRPQSIVFLTDGDVGDEGTLIRLLETRIGGSGVRLFPFGIGEAPNAYLVHRMAEAGRGLARFIADDTAVAREMADLFVTLDAPVWTDVKLSLLDDRGAALAGTILPRQLSDVFAGQPIQAMFATATGTAATVVVEARQGDQPVRLQLPVQGRSRGDGVEKQFGRKLYEEQESALRRAATEPEKTAAQGLMLATALRYQLVTPLTSRVAVDTVVSRVAGTPLRSAAVPQQAPNSGGGSSSDRDVLVLSPFQVDSSEDGDGYYTTSCCCCGVRMTRALRDVGSALTVLTAQFLKDLSRSRTEDALSYTRETGAEVALAPLAPVLVDDLPFATMSDAAFIDRIVFQPLHPEPVQVTQHAAAPVDRTVLTARIGDDGYFATMLDASRAWTADKSWSSRAILTHANYGQAQTGARIQVKRSAQGEEIRGTLQWQRLAGYGDLRLLKVSAAHDGDVVTGDVTAAWQELRRTDATQFARDSATARYDNLGFLNLDQLTAPARRFSDRFAQAAVLVTLPGTAGRHRGAVIADWHRQEADWLTPLGFGSDRRDRLGLRLDWRSHSSDERLALEANAGWSNHRTPGQTVASRGAGEASVMASWELREGWRVFARATDQSNLPWLSTGLSRNDAGRWLAVSPRLAESRSGQAGLHVSALDSRLVVETTLFRENVRNLSYRDWAWERDHAGTGVVELAGGIRRQPFSYGNWPELRREGWTGQVEFQPTRAFTTVLKWQVDWRNEGPYRGGNRQASVAGAYTLQEGWGKGLGFGGGCSLRNTLKYDDDYLLRGGLRADCFLKYERRLGSGRRLTTQLNVANIGDGPAQPTRFAFDHGRQVMLSQAWEF